MGLGSFRDGWHLPEWWRVWWSPQPLHHNRTHDLPWFSLANGARVHCHADAGWSGGWRLSLWVSLCSDNNYHAVLTLSRIYYDAINSADPGHTLEITGSALFPKGPAFSATTAFFNDFVFMAIFTCIAFSLGDDQNSPPGQGMTALIFGFVGYLMMVSLGYNTGLGISPARDLGPRLVGLWAGYDSFADAYWAYGPFGASTSGAIFGGFIYDLFVFVGGESPVNYRWPEKGDIEWRWNKKKEQTKEFVHNNLA
jgi:hypothetical protein